MQNKSHIPTFRRMGHWAKTHRPAALGIVGIITILIAAIAAWYAHAVKPDPVSIVPGIIHEQEEVKYYSPLTGIEVKNIAATKQAVTAVMIENSPAARPHSGLKEAGIVYEAISEAGITRFIALYQEDKPKLIGPVRSIRTYFLDWAAPYNASIAHVGGSPQALAIVRNGNYRDIDQFFNSAAYWRSSDRYAPHNVYTNFKRLDALNKQKGYKKSSFTGFTRIAPGEDAESAGSKAANSIAINFSSSDYNTRYTYDRKKDRYKRFLGGKKHIDREKGQITPRVVIALHVNQKKAGDGYHESITTTGSGKATVFQNGRVITATWKKSGRNEPLRIIDKNGDGLPLARGQTWIAAVPNSGGSVSWRK